MDFSSSVFHYLKSSSIRRVWFLLVGHTTDCKHRGGGGEIRNSNCNCFAGNLPKVSTYQAEKKVFVKNSAVFPYAKTMKGKSCFQPYMELIDFNFKWFYGAKNRLLSCNLR